MRTFIAAALMFAFSAAAVAQQMRISEVMANPSDAQGGERAGEFVELFNLGPEPVDLSGWSVADDISKDMIIPFETDGQTLLNPLAFAVVLDPDYEGQYGELPPDILLMRPENAAIGNGLSALDSLRLMNPDGAVVDEFIPPSSAQDGVSFERIDLNAPGSADNWRSSNDPSGSTIGRPPNEQPPPPVEPTPAPLMGIVLINEIMFQPSTDAPEWVELRSLDKKEIAVKNWTIEDERERPAPIPDAVIPPEGYLILTQSAEEFRAAHPETPKETPVIELPLPALNNDGDLVRLRLDGELIDEVRYEKRNGRRGQSLERRDPKMPSQLRDNWLLSVHATGSTPGRPNTAAFDAPEQPTLKAAPNPFDPHETSAELRYEAPLTAKITLRVFNSAGVPQRELLYDAPRGGRQTIRWDGRNDAGRYVAPGIYIVMLLAIEDGRHSATAMALVVAER